MTKEELVGKDDKNVIENEVEKVQLMSRTREKVFVFISDSHLSTCKCGSMNSLTFAALCQFFISLLLTEIPIFLALHQAKLNVIIDSFGL